MSSLVIGIAVGAGTLLVLYGASRLRGGAATAEAPADGDKRQGASTEGRPGMKVQLCKKGIERLGPGMESLLDALREREHTPVVRECLSRCQECNAGQLLAIADGMPLGAANAERLLADLDELSADDR
jgi:hypothetical protein